MNAIVTGANRGIGLEMTKQLSARGEEVWATCRRPRDAAKLQQLSQETASLHVLELDVADVESIERCRALLYASCDKLDLLFCCAGIFPGKKGADADAESFGHLSFGTAIDTFTVNSVAPLMLAQAFDSLLKKAERPVFACVSSGYGSVSNNNGFPYSYAASKAALNMYLRSYAHDEKQKSVLALALDPGWVRTDMGGEEASISVEQSAEGILKVIDHTTEDQHGQFIDWRGQTVSW